MSEPLSPAAPRPAGFLGALYRWLDRNIFELGREMRLSYLPPLMVYVAAGISGLTGIVGTFFVKEYLGLSAEFLAALGFWAGLPWALKMPLGHLVDLIWKWKAGLVYLGASLIAASLGIMIGLLSAPDAMRGFMPAEAWRRMRRSSIPMASNFASIAMHSKVQTHWPTLNPVITFSMPWPPCTLNLKS